MRSHSIRLDKLISQHTGTNKRDVKLLLARKQVLVDDVVCSDADRVIGQFNKVQINDELVQHQIPVYIMLIE